MRKAWGSPLLFWAIALVITANASAQISQEGMVASCSQLASEAARLGCFDALARASQATQRGLIPALLFEWQTLVAGVLAVVVAVSSVRAVRQQIQVAKEQEDERMRRRHAAARASLPLRLNEVVEFTKAYATEIRKLRPTAESDEDAAPTTTDRFNPPEVPPALIDSLERMIEASPEEAVQDTLADLISRIQVLSSVMRFLAKNQNLNSHSFAVRVVDIAEIHTIAVALFRYARRESKGPTYPALGVDLHLSLRLLDFSDADRDSDIISKEAKGREGQQVLQALAKRSRRRQA